MTLSHIPVSEKGYRILALLGQGGMALIQLAVRRGPGGFRKLFVVKQLRPDLANPGFARMFLHEARLAALLSHPNIVHTYEVRQDKGQSFLEMEYLEGQTLARLVRRVTRKELPLEIHLHILTELLSGLEYVHELKDLAGNSLRVVHRDISPGNLFLTYDGQVKLLDFGIAKSIELIDLPTIGPIKGKVGYMSPEQASASKVDHRSDLYSVGIMLWEAIACQPFVRRGEPSAESLSTRRAGQYRPIELVCPDVAPELAAICRKALASDPNERYQSAPELRQDLIAYIQERSSLPTRESVAEVLRHLFAHERAELDDQIAEKLSSGAPAQAPLLSSRLFRGAGTGSIPRQNLVQFAKSKLEVNSSDPRKRTIAISAGALVIGALAIFGMTRSQSEPKNTAPKSTVKAATPVLPPAPAPIKSPVKKPKRQRSPEKRSKVRFSLRLSPPQAQAELDGKLLGRGSIERLFVRDTKEHHLVLRLRGYQTVERIVVFDRDHSIEMVLQSMNQRRRAFARPARPRPNNVLERTKKPEDTADPRPTTQAPTKHPEKKLQIGDDLRKLQRNKNREIDEENPYQ